MDSFGNQQEGKNNLPDEKETQRLNSLLKLLENGLRDIKLPISEIQSYSRLLFSQSGASPETRETAEAINQSCFSLLKMAKGLDEAGKIFSGRLTPVLVNTEIISETESATLFFSPMAQRKGVRIDFNSNAAEKYMAVDKALYNRMLLNLISNAIERTPIGGNVTVNITATKTLLQIDVTDGGIAVPSGFDAFGRCENLSSYEEDLLRLGLGLAIVREIAQNMNGIAEPINNFDEQGEACRNAMRVCIPVFLAKQDDSDDYDFLAFYPLMESADTIG